MAYLAKTGFLVVTMVFTVIGAPLDNDDRVTVTDPKKVTNYPRIVTRGEWHARNCSAPYSPMVSSPAPYVVAHHGGIPHYCHDEETCSRIVRGYQDFHMDTHRWIDVGYHFIIGGDGNVYEGRGWDNVGAHAPGFNGQGIGICIIGDYTSRMPNNSSLEAFKSLIEYGISIGKVKPDYKLIGHRQGRATECPGETFYNYLKTLSHWEASPKPVRGVLTSVVDSKSKPVKAVAPTVDITGSKLWADLIALGESEPREFTGNSTTDGIVEENIVDTGNTGGKISSN